MLLSFLSIVKGLSSLRGTHSFSCLKFSITLFLNHFLLLFFCAGHRKAPSCQLRPAVEPSDNRPVQEDAMRLQKDVHPFATSMSVLTTLLSCFRMAKGQIPPSVTGRSNAPTNVPDYVIKYGMTTNTQLEDGNEGAGTLSYPKRNSQRGIDVEIGRGRFLIRTPSGDI